MGKKLLCVFMTIIITVIFNACSDGVSQNKETSVVDGIESNVSMGSKASNSTEQTEESSFFEVPDGQGYYIDDDGNIVIFGVKPPTVTYNGHEYWQYGNPWQNYNEDRLNKNFTYLGEAEYYPDYEPYEQRGNFTTNIDENGCKIYRCNDEDTYIFTLWSDGRVCLFVQGDLTEEERESASASTDWIWP